MDWAAGGPEVDSRLGIGVTGSSIPSSFFASPDWIDPIGTLLARTRLNGLVWHPVGFGSVQAPSLLFRLPTKLRPGAISLLLAAGVVAGVVVVLRSQQERPAPVPTPSAQAHLPTVTALGRLAPIGEVCTIAAPSSTSGQQTILRLLVEEGDAVHQGQVLAVLDGQPRLQRIFVEPVSEIAAAEPCVPNTLQRPEFRLRTQRSGVEEGVFVVKCRHAVFRTRR